MSTFVQQQRSGHLLLRPIQAKLLHDTEKIGKMSPYIKFILGNTIETSPAAKHMHLTPSWNCEIVMRVRNDSMLKIELWNKELLSKDDLIGSCTIPIFDWVAKGAANGYKITEWLPLFYKDLDAGALLLDMTFFPDGEIMGVSQGMMTQSTQFLSENLGGQQLNQSRMGFATIPTTQSYVMQSNRPYVNTETVVVKDEPVRIQERPIVYEKEIIREQPIIVEKERILNEQPIIVEKPELHEKVVHQTVQPTVVQEQPIMRQENAVLTQKPVLEGQPVVYHETEVQRDQAQYYRERPELYQKEVIMEKPVIHEKEIVQREVPIIVEKPEVVQRVMEHRDLPETVRDQPIIHPEKQIYTDQPVELKEQPIVHKEPTELYQETPAFIKETPELYERRVIHEKPIIHEQQILRTEKEVIHERPETFTTRIFHQEPTIRRVDPTGRFTTEQANP